MIYFLEIVKGIKKMCPKLCTEPFVTRANQIYKTFSYCKQYTNISNVFFFFCYVIACREQQSLSKISQYRNTVNLLHRKINLINKTIFSKNQINWRENTAKVSLVMGMNLFVPCDKILFKKAIGNKLI